MHVPGLKNCEKRPFRAFFVDRGGGGLFSMRAWRVGNMKPTKTRRDKKMKVLADDVRVVSKNHRTGTNSRGDWEMFELECSTGEGGTITLGAADKEMYDSLQAFTPYTIEINLYKRGYNLGGEVTQVWDK